MVNQPAEQRQSVFRRAASLLPALLGCVLAWFPVAPIAAPPAPPLPTQLPVASERYDLPSGGQLLLDVPLSWQVVYVRADDGSPPSLYLTPLEGRGFELIISVYEAPGGLPMAPETVHAMVERAGREALRLAPEQALQVRPWPGGITGAFVFELKDEEAAPGPNGYPLLVQGAAALGQDVLVFTLLGAIDGVEREETLRMLRAARILRSKVGV